MKDHAVTKRLELRWIRTVDAQGRARLESHWVEPAARPVHARQAA
ncbi:hypothetical protein [Nocardioides insulae]|nr:hypothetical protein [Nocardioides insulae]